MYDNEVYALTKNQTSPTTRKAHKTSTQPYGTMLDPLNPVKLALGIGASFVASTADWMADHLVNTIKVAFAHNGFAFVHISQRCPHFDEENFDHKTTSWFSYLKHEKGITPDKRLAEKAEVIEHDPSNLQDAFKYAESERRYYGLFYRNEKKPRYDELLRNLVKNTPQKPRSGILDAYLL